MNDIGTPLNELASRGELLIRESARKSLDFRAPLHFRSDESIPQLHFHARWLARKLVDRERGGTQPVQAGHILALGLLNEAFRIVIQRYESETDVRIAAYLPAGSDALDLFRSSFPPVPDAMFGSDESVQKSIVSYLGKEILLTHIANLNPACGPLNLLIDDSALKLNPAYAGLLERLANPLENVIWAEHSGRTLMQLLLEPILRYPDSLFNQLEFIAQVWKDLLGDFIVDLQRGMDVLREENQARLAGPGDAGQFIQGWLPQPDDAEAYSSDQSWMGELALIAKNTYVWLSQLSEVYGRSIRRLDEIPDEELNRLKDLGITGLWLIGVWERSRASRKIKQMMGATDAVASAYSLHDYMISEELGGQAALENLRARAWNLGIRLASDMVPNHMGIDSRWIVERPEWFLQLEQSPFPGYSFSGPNLSDDDRIEIYIEDHYFDQTDAAVVFKRVERRTGEVAYVYHGNDGTSMPWNDTAQLNYLSEAVRAEVIRVIVNVARQFPIIRFDAAMTLAKRHIQRLWFPEPSKGGAIPSRSQMGMSGAEFDRLVPIEFWREVVDRVAVEAPDTLLLAEAFWMMEGYFVRTLGMHRVYNSAFMHMLRDQRNAEYRNAIKATVASNPQVLKRYVNFMNNPDEESAAEQFGKGDKYFGVCLLMATLPGLPMFGHGQFEGFTEKYGMEFTKPRMSEQADGGFEEHHKQVIVPFLRHRKLLSGVDKFYFFDCALNTGGVAEDVYAYSNGDDNHQFLVLYHNCHAHVDFHVRDSVPHFGRNGTIRIGEVLGLPASENTYAIAREIVSGKEFLYNCLHLNEIGLGIHLGPYEYRVYSEFRTVTDTDGEYAALEKSLGGSGVFSVEEALDTHRLKPVQLVVGNVFDLIVSNSRRPDSDQPHVLTVQQAVAVLSSASVWDRVGECDPVEILRRMEFWEILSTLSGTGQGTRPRGLPSALRWLRSGMQDFSLRTALHLSTFLSFFFRCILRFRDQANSGENLAEWRLESVLVDALRGLEVPGLSPASIAKLVIANALIARPEISENVEPGWGFRELKHWLSDSLVADALGSNEAKGAIWLSREKTEMWLWLRFASAVQECTVLEDERESGIAIGRQYLRYAGLQRALEKSGCEVGELLNVLKNKRL